MDSRSGPAESSESKKSRNGSLGCAELDAAELAAKNLKASEQAREKLSSAFADSPSELLLQRRWPRRSRTDGKKHPITVREVILDCVGVLGSDPDASLYSILEKLCKANRLARRIRNILLDRSIKPVEALTEFARIREALDVCKGIDVGDVSSTGYPKALSLLGEVLWSIEDYRTKKEFIVRVREGELVAHAVSALEKGKSRAYCEPTVAAFLGLAYGEYVRRELGGSNGWKLNVSELKQYRDVFGDLGAIMSWLPSHFDSKNAVGQISHFGSGFLEHYRVAMREKGSSPEKEANAERALVNLSIFVGDGRIVQAKQVAERVAKMEGVRGAPIRKPVDDLTARARSGFIHVARAIPGRGSDVKVGLREVLRAGNWSAVDVGVLAMQRDELMSDGANLKPEEIVSILRKSDAELRDRYPHADTIQQRAQCAFQEEDY